MDNRNKSQQGQRAANEKRPHCIVKWNTSGREGNVTQWLTCQEGPHFTRHTISDTPPPLRTEWKGGFGIHLSVVDHDELISTVRELRIQFWIPPTAKGRTIRGLQNGTSIVDLDGWTLAVQICLPLILKHIHVPA
jgi:hypothetical protein